MQFEKRVEHQTMLSSYVCQFLCQCVLSTNYDQNPSGVILESLVIIMVTAQSVVKKTPRCKVTVCIAIIFAIVHGMTDYNHVTVEPTS